MANQAFIENGAQGIRETDATEHENMLSRISYLYQQNPVVTLSVVSSGGNITPNMTDRRYKSGTAARNTSGPWPAVTSFPGEGSTGEPVLVTGTTYDKISQTVTSAPDFLDADYQALNTKPVFRDTDNSLREMSYNECVTHFIDPIVTNMISTTSTAQSAGGSYYISTASSATNSTNLGTVFADTVADLSSYTAAGIGVSGTFQDHANTTTFSLMRIDSGIATQGSGYRTPLMIDYSSNSHNSPAGLRHMTYAEFDALFAPFIRYAIFALPGYTLRYNVNGAGTRQGTSMTNKEMVGVTGQYTTFKASGDDYRAQEFPNGTITVIDTWNLNLERT